MMSLSIKKRIAFIVAVALVVLATVNVFSIDVYAKAAGNKPIVGVSYKLKQPQFVYRGHSKKSGKKKIAELSDTAKKFAVKGRKDVRFKKGTVVTCLEVYKGWIRVPSGWIKFNYKDFKRIKHRG